MSNGRARRLLDAVESAITAATPAQLLHMFHPTLMIASGPRLRIASARRPSLESSASSMSPCRWEASIKCELQIPRPSSNARISW